MHCAYSADTIVVYLRENGVVHVGIAKGLVRATIKRKEKKKKIYITFAISHKVQYAACLRQPAA